MIGKMVRRPAVDCLILLAIAVLFAIAFRHAVPPAPFVYDESDYMTVARAGLWGNYAEPQSMSLAGFVKVGLKALHGEMGRTGLSDYIRELHDTSFYRHYHGPLYFYWLVFANAVFGGNEYLVRATGLLFHLLTFSTIVLGLPWAFGKQYRPAGWLGGGLYLFSLNNIMAVTDLSTHVIFLWVSMLGLILIARFANEPARRNYYVALAGCAVALCAQEYGMLLFACLALAVFLRREEVRREWPGWFRLALVSIGVAAGVILVVWPAGVLKGTLVEGILLIGYLSKYRKGSFGTETPMGVWIERFQHETVDCVVLLACVVAIGLYLWRSPRRNALLPVLLYPAIMLLTMLKNTSGNPRYFSSIPAPVIAAAAVLMGERLRKVPAVAMAAGICAIAAVLAVSAWAPAIASGSRTDPGLIPMIELARREPVHTMLAPFLYRPSLSYYFPDRLVLAMPQDADRAAIADQIQRGNPDMVCVYGWQALPGRVAGRIESSYGELVCTVK
jgi:hypothetical protein